MRLGFVVQRYGLDIAGGAEYHCRLIAEHLARHAEVEVLTTCASDYISWADHYPEGVERLNGVTVRRFRVKRPRDTDRFAAWSARVFAGGQDEAAELRWLEEQGPLAPRLPRFLERERDRYDLFVVFSYRYYTSYHALRVVADKALLVPTAEDDGVYRLSIFRRMFRLPRAIVWNSLEERAMIEEASGCRDVPGDVVGVGSALPERLDPAGFRRRHGIEGPFALYIGRVDRNKGCPELVSFFRRYRAETGSRLKLVLIGKAVIELPRDPGIVPLGFLPEQDKWDGLAAAELLAMPSRYESLSMVTLEAWWAGRPVLVNGRCAVLRGQCRRSNAGLYYGEYADFAEALGLLEQRAELREALGRNGRRYFDAHYAWDVIERKYLRLLDEAGSAPLSRTAGA